MKSTQHLKLSKHLKLQNWLTTLAILACFFAQNLSAESAGKYRQGSGGVNSQQQQDKPYLILVSIDGFRWDYMDLYSTPNMDRIANTGVRAERLLPQFPTLTFPNHYSIATGLYPANHGLVGNEFPGHERGKWYALHDRQSVEDGWFYEGEPIWVTAETQGMVAASFFFVGTEAPIQGVYPSYWRQGTAYLPTEAPAQWHIDDNSRFPDVLLMPKAGFAVLSSPEKTKKLNPGDHGWIPEMPEMHGFFIATGPNINPGISLGPVENVDIYPFMTAILGLQASAKLDGDPDKLSSALRSK